MQTYTSTQARANIATVLDTALNGEPVEITRRDGSSAVLISKAAFEAYQNAKLDAEFDAIMQRHEHTIEALTWVSAQEVIAFHDRILQRFPGVAGLTDPGRAQALIYRVQNRVHYEGVTDLFELAATYWVAIARGHIFHDGNKRTAFFVTMTFHY